MVCKKLKKGKCKDSRKVCKEGYLTKMGAKECRKAKAPKKKKLRFSFKKKAKKKAKKKSKKR